MGQYKIGDPQPEFKDLATCPLLVDKTAIAATGVPRSLRFHRSETCFGKPVRPPPSAKTTEASAREAVAEALAVARKIVSGSPTGQPPAPEQRSARERRRGFGMAVAEASAVAWKVVSRSNGPAPSAKITEASASDASPRLSRKLQPSPRKFSREARRARPQRQNDGNELSGSPTGQTQAQTFDDSSRREKWHATRPGRVSANPKP